MKTGMRVNNSRSKKKANAKKNKYSDVEIITEEHVRTFEKIHDLDTSPRITPFIFLIASIICIFSTMTILIYMGIVLATITLICFSRKSYWTAHIYRQAVLMYLQDDYDGCRRYLNKIPKQEKETECYKEFLSLVNDKIAPKTDKGEEDSIKEDNLKKSDDISIEEKNNEEITACENPLTDMDVYNEVKEILSENRRDLTKFYMTHTDDYCDLCVSSEVFLRVKLKENNQYVLTNLNGEDIKRLNLNVENAAKEENYNVRVKLNSKGIIRKLTTYIIQEYDNCSVRY